MLRVPPFPGAGEGMASCGFHSVSQDEVPLWTWGIVRSTLCAVEVPSILGPGPPGGRQPPGEVGSWALTFLPVLVHRMRGTLPHWDGLECKEVIVEMVATHILG